MTTPSTARKAGPYTGNGVTTAWPFTFKVFAASDIKVTVANTYNVETVLVLTTDYTVSVNANQDTSPGGTVAYALPDGFKLTITGALPYDQPLDLPSGGNFSPVALENQLDRTAMQLQQMREELGRAVLLPVSSNVITQLPTPAPQQLIGWDVSGTALVNLSAEDFLTVAGSSSFATQTLSGTGAATVFTLNENPGVIANLEVYISGVRQTPTTDYTISGTTLTFTSAPPAGTSNILVRWGQTLGINVPADGSVRTASFAPTAKAPLAGAADTAADATNATNVTGTIASAVTAVTQTPGDNSTKVATTAFVQAALPVGGTGAGSERQTVLSGPVDASGYANFGGSTGSSTVTAAGTLVVDAANGATGYTGTIVNPSWTGLNSGGRMFLGLTVAANGTCTPFATTLAPVYQWGGTPAVTANQFTFNIQEMRGYLGNGTTAPQSYSVIVGEVTTTGTGVTSITWYQLRGRYDSGQQSLAFSTNYAFNHRIGMTPRIYAWYFECVSADLGYAIGDSIQMTSVADPGFWTLYTFMNATQVGIGALSINMRLQHKSLGTTVTVTALSNWRQRFVAYRGW
jgi:hypothetical protein